MECHWVPLFDFKHDPAMTWVYYPVDIWRYVFYLLNLLSAGRMIGSYTILILGKKLLVILQVGQICWSFVVWCQLFATAWWMSPSIHDRPSQTRRPDTLPWSPSLGALRCCTDFNPLGLQISQKIMVRMLISFRQNYFKLGIPIFRLSYRNNARLAIRHSRFRSTRLRCFSSNIFKYNVQASFVNLSIPVA
jgi:hypothetical protein